MPGRKRTLIPRLLYRGAVLRRSSEQLPSIGKTHTVPVCGVAAILGAVTLDDHFVAGLQRVLSPTGSYQSIRVAGFDHPAGDFTLLIFRVEGDPSVRIDQFPLHHNSCEGHRLGEVILRAERVMGGQRNNSAQDQRNCQQANEARSHNTFPYRNAYIMTDRTLPVGSALGLRSALSRETAGRSGTG